MGSGVSLANSWLPGRGYRKLLLPPSKLHGFENCKIMNSTLFSIERGGNGSQGAKPGGEGHTCRAPSASHRCAPTQVRVPSNTGEGAIKQEVGGGRGVRAAAGPSPQEMRTLVRLPRLLHAG